MPPLMPTCQLAICPGCELASGRVLICRWSRALICRRQDRSRLRQPSSRACSQLTSGWVDAVLPVPGRCAGGNILPGQEGSAGAHSLGAGGRYRRHAVMRDCVGGR
jgi:hypothetical protein